MISGIRTVLAITALGVIAEGAMAQDSEYGQSLFMNNCAVCHGANGTGDGPLTGLLKDQPKDLTQLSAANNGAFPFSEVYQAIDRRREVPGHGTEDMPIWGQLFEVDALPKTFHPGVDAEEIVQARILALVYYLQSIQK